MVLTVQCSVTIFQDPVWKVGTSAFFRAVTLVTDMFGALSNSTWIVFHRSFVVQEAN